MKKSIIRRYLVLSLAFGLAMGLFFPIFAGFFVTFPSTAHLFWFSFACVVAGLAVGLFSFAIGSSTVVAVIRRLSVRLEDLASRDGDLTTRLDVVSDDVVGALVDRFHRFQGRLRDLVVSLQEIADRTRRSGLELSANTVETSAAAEQIRKNTDAVLAGTRGLETELEAVAQAKEAINGSAMKTFEAVNRQSMSLLTLAALMESNLGETVRVSQETAEQSRQAGENLEGSRQSLEGLRQVAAATRSIQADGREIQDLVQSIDDVAEQISILGVNAAIEAARAGASGRGFTVVADQVRKLASLSKDNAGKVAATMGRIQAKVEGTALSSTRSETDLTRLMEVIDGFSRSLGNLAGVLSSHAENSRIMLQALKDLEGVTGDVNTGTASLMQHTAEIDEALKKTSQTADENLRALEEIAVGIAQISQEAQALRAISQDNADTGERLSAELARFKV